MNSGIEIVGLVGGKRYPLRHFSSSSITQKVAILPIITEMKRYHDAFRTSQQDVETLLSVLEKPKASIEQIKDHMRRGTGDCFKEELLLTSGNLLRTVQL
jgi:hypothetical protein